MCPIHSFLPAQTRIEYAPQALTCFLLLSILHSIETFVSNMCDGQNMSNPLMHSACSSYHTTDEHKKNDEHQAKIVVEYSSMHLNIKRFSPSAFIAGYRSSSILMRHAWAGNTQYTKRLCVVIRAVERAKKSMRKRFSFHKSIPFFCAHSFIHPRGTSHHCHSRQRLRTQFESLLFGVALNI